MSAQDRCTVWPNVPRAWKSFWQHPMDLLGGVGQMKARFDPFGDSVSHDARLVHGLHQLCNRHRNHFGVHSMELLGMCV
jgi:hypothetical protein